MSGLAFKNNEVLQNSFIDNHGELTLINNLITNSVGPDGSINNAGILTIINSTISHNIGYESGGINNTGVLEITNSTISNNSASGRGGGINNTGPLEITNSTISNNATYGQGGGIFNSSDTLGNPASLSNSTVSGNTAVGGGGGIDNTGFLKITNSTISDNRALNEGGGIDSPGELGLTNSTVSDNTALTFGGGIAVSSPFYTIFYCTIYRNTATQDGGGIATYQNRPKVPFIGIGESIVAGNHAQTSPNISGVIWSHGYNLFQNVSPSTNFVPLNVQSTDVEVSAATFLGIDSLLRKNGGQTPTHALISGSPAIDSIPPDTCQVIGITTDQRGVKRPQGDGCDIGAYEYKSSP